MKSLKRKGKMFVINLVTPLYAKHYFFAQKILDIPHKQEKNTTEKIWKMKIEKCFQ